MATCKPPEPGNNPETLAWDETEILRGRLRNEFGKFKAPLIADELQSRWFWKTTRDTDEVYYYNGQYYEPQGEKKIREIINTWLREDYSAHLASETIENIKARSYINRDEQRGILCAENGLLYINGLKLFPFSPDRLVTRKLPIEFNPQADCPQCKQFFKEVLNEEDIAIVQEMFGYCLLDGMPYQKAFLMIGAGANGKSTLIGLLQAMLGKENTCAISLQELDENKFSASRLYGKLVNMFADLPSQALRQTGKFKMLVGGDLVEAEKKFKDGFAFNNTTKLIFSCNTIPKTSDSTDAFFRRWIFITFPHIFTDTDPNTKKNLLVILTTKQELSGLLNWSLEGLGRLVRQGNFSNSKETNALRDYYERMSNPVASFVKDRIESGDPYKIDAEGIVEKDELYAAYVVYCQETRLPATASNQFARELAQFCPSVRGERHRVDGRMKNVWKGLQYIINKDTLQGKLE